MFEKLVKNIPLFFVFLFLFSCAASGPAGTWNYHIKDTPEGDFKGNMVIEKNKKGYTGYLSTEGNNIDLNNVTIEDNLLSGKFNYQGNTLELIGEFSEESFDGKVKAGYESFPMTAEKAE